MRSESARPRPGIDVRTHAGAVAARDTVSGATTRRADDRRDAQAATHVATSAGSSDPLPSTTTRELTQSCHVPVRRPHLPWPMASPVPELPLRRMVYRAAGGAATVHLLRQARAPARARRHCARDSTLLPRRVSRAAPFFGGQAGLHPRPRDPMHDFSLRDGASQVACCLERLRSGGWGGVHAAAS
jgi:hypothetical protein